MTEQTVLEIPHLLYLDLRDRLGAHGIVPSAWADGRQGLRLGSVVLLAPIDSPGGERVPYKPEDWRGDPE